MTTHCPAHTLKECARKIAASPGTEFAFLAKHKVMPINVTDFTNACAVVTTTADLPEVWTELDRLGFDIPILPPWNMVKPWLCNGCLSCMA